MKFNRSRKGCLKGSRKGSGNHGHDNSNATSTCNTTTTHLNATQHQLHLKPRRGLEESKTCAVISRNSNGPIGEEMTR